MLHHILVPFSKLWGFLLLKSFPGAGWYLHPEQEGRWARGIQHTKLGNYPRACRTLRDYSQKNSMWSLSGTWNLSQIKKKKSRWRAMPLYFWPLAKLQRNYCFRGRAGASSLPCLENNLCFWDGCAHGWGLMDFIASWHCGMCIFFSFLHPASVEQALACKQLVPGASINSPCFQLSTGKDFFQLV